MIESWDIEGLVLRTLYKIEYVDHEKRWRIADVFAHLVERLESFGKYTFRPFLTPKVAEVAAAYPDYKEVIPLFRRALLSNYVGTFQFTPLSDKVNPLFKYLLLMSTVRLVSDPESYLFYTKILEPPLDQLIQFDYSLLSGLMLDPLVHVTISHLCAIQDLSVLASASRLYYQEKLLIASPYSKPLFLFPEVTCLILFPNFLIKFYKASQESGMNLHLAKACMEWAKIGDKEILSALV